MKTFGSITLLLFQITTYAQVTKLEIPDKPIISVVGFGSVSVFPNAAQLVISLNHLKPTLREAVNENQSTTKQIVEIIKKYLTDTSSIKTSFISTSKRVEWNEKTNRDVFIGFVSSQKIIFTLKHLAKMQEFTEDLLLTKFQKIEKISYFHTDAIEFLKKAQGNAVIDAIETSERLAKVSNLKIGKVVYLQTDKSPTDIGGKAENTYDFDGWGKAMGGRGVSSSGELINYSVSVTLHTEIVD
jgi:uncharacterized protein